AKLPVSEAPRGIVGCGAFFELRVGLGQVEFPEIAAVRLLERPHAAPVVAPATSAVSRMPRSMCSILPRFRVRVARACVGDPRPGSVVVSFGRTMRSPRSITARGGTHE